MLSQYLVHKNDDNPPKEGSLGCQNQSMHPLGSMNVFTKCHSTLYDTVGFKEWHIMYSDNFMFLSWHEYIHRKYNKQCCTKGSFPASSAR